MDDLDDKLELLQPPSNLLLMVQPPLDLRVSDFLELPLPRETLVSYEMSPEDWFTVHPATHTPHSMEDLILPLPKLCLRLDDHLRVALTAGHSSMRHPEKF